MGELQASGIFPGRNYIPSMLKPARFGENFGVVGVKLKQGFVLLFLFHIFHADLDRESVY